MGKSQKRKQIKMCNQLSSFYKTLLLIIVSTGFCSVNSFAADLKRYSTPGVACQPTSLGQALNLNASWNQRRIFNPNPIGSNLSYFVTSPVFFGDSVTTYTGMHDILVYKHKEVPEANAVTCFAQHI